MIREEFQLVPAETLTASDVEAIAYLKNEIAGGTHWYLALLGAIGLWTSSEEKYNGRTYIYLIDGEAFDWLLLAERLSDTIRGCIPENELEALLFHSVTPLQLDASEVRELIGDKKYGMYLNYFYGIIVEEALLLAVQEEVDKERHVQGISRHHDSSGEAFHRIYGVERDDLFAQFRKEKSLPKNASTSLDEMKQFTYWLFKYRFKRSEKARIASDTKKALNYLTRLWQSKGVSQLLAVDLAAAFN